MDTMLSLHATFHKQPRRAVWLPLWECSLSPSSHLVFTFLKLFKAWSALFSRPLYPHTTLLQARATLTCRLAGCLGGGVRCRPSPCSYMAPRYLQVARPRNPPLFKDHHDGSSDQLGESILSPYPASWHPLIPFTHIEVR